VGYTVVCLSVTSYSFHKPLSSASESSISDNFPLKGHQRVSAKCDMVLAKYDGHVAVTTDSYLDFLGGGFKILSRLFFIRERLMVQVVAPPIVLTLAKARIKGSLSCIRPAVSTKTTSNLLSRATVNKEDRGLKGQLTKEHDSDLFSFRRKFHSPY
jgi:hypothetical protein